MKDKQHRAALGVASGGILAALSVIFMSMSGLIPVFTYVTPMLCAFLVQIVLQSFGARMAWAWYGTVAILGALLSPDKEAAMVFLFLGYYPILKPFLDARKLPALWKVTFFHLAIVAIYGVLIWILGIPEIRNEFQGMGIMMLAVLLILGNVTFFMMDILLKKTLFQRKWF